MHRFDFPLKKSIPLFIAGIIIILVLAAFTGTDEIIGALGQTDKRIYALAFLVQVLAIFVWLGKWKILTRAIDLEVGTRRMFPILLSGIL